MPITQSTDVPIRRSMARSTSWEDHASSVRHRVALVLILIVAAIVLFVVAPRARGDEVSDREATVKKVESADRSA